MTAWLLGLLLTGCTLVGPMNGEWDVESDDYDDCEATLDLVQRGGGRIEGFADIECHLYLCFGDGYCATVAYEDRDGEVEGRISGDDVELEMAFEIDGGREYDDWPFDVFIEADLDHRDEFEGVLYFDDDLLDMEELGDVTGEKE